QCADFAGFFRPTVYISLYANGISCNKVVCESKDVAICRITAIVIQRGTSGQTLAVKMPPSA
ncbi:hypothetical protein K0G63_15500, partial [Bacteroides fragilis]|nr:hypothetical protein [Bacteroides fragilis]MCE9314566.1 hypothetical protein [Bacteroides fragilis]